MIVLYKKDFDNQSVWGDLIESAIQSGNLEYKEGIQDDDEISIIVKVIKAE